VQQQKLTVVVILQATLQAALLEDLETYPVIR